VLIKIKALIKATSFLFSLDTKNEVYGATIINYVVKIWLPIGEYQEYDSKLSQSLRYCRESTFRLYLIAFIILYCLMSILEKKRDLYIPQERLKYTKLCFSLSF